MVHVPQDTPHAPAEEPLVLEGGRLVFPTAMYDKLHTNIPKGLMRFSDKEFPEESKLFPGREDVLECEFDLI